MHRTWPKALVAAADAPTELMKLREAEAVRVLDQHDRGVGHVHTDLDHSRRHQHIDLTVAEGAHDAVLLGWAQLAVDQAQAQIGEHL